MAFGVKLSGKDFSHNSNKIETDSVGVRKCPYY